MRLGNRARCLAFVFAGYLCCHAWAGSEQPPAVGFGSDAWTIVPGGRVVEHLGRESLAGSAYLEGVEFADGVIEVDIAMDGRRCFPGILFRAESPADDEIIYLRPHRPTNYSHALQYTPSFRGLTGWQLYSGPGFTANTAIPLNQWVHLKVEVKGTRARVFFGDMDNPALYIDELQRGKSKGFIGVTGPPDGRVFFSNFRFSTGNDLDFGPQPIRAITPGDLGGWEISQVIAPVLISRDVSPFAQDLGEITWRPVTADARGLVDIARFLDRPPSLPGCVVARTTISAAAPERRKLLFGYSDEISIFLNGRLLFRGDSTFTVRDSEFIGVIGLNDAVVLDLAKGDNQLVFVVTESFGGWGFMARSEGLHDDPVVLAAGVAKKWELKEGLAMPESAAWDPKREVFYVSNMNPGGAPGVDGGYIMRIDPSGTVLDEKWVTGLRQPTGVAVDGDRLYVVERTGVVVIDLESGEIVDRRIVETDGGYLNDLAVDSNGTVFISDSARGVIYRSTPGGTEAWSSDAAHAGANGLLVQDGALLVVTMGSESLITMDLESRKVEKIVSLRPFGGDGITAVGADAFLVSDYHGQLLRVTLGGDRRVLIDTREAGISLTDFAFASGRSLALVPTLRGNSLLAFDLGGVIANEGPR